MTLGDMKQKVYRLIEEIDTENENLTQDPDFNNKINVVIDLIQKELARIKKIPAIETLDVYKGAELELDNLDNFYQLSRIKGVNYDQFGKTVEMKETGTVKIYYYRYPNKIDHTSLDKTILELSEDALAIMPYGVAADILKSDVSNQYGQIYANRYKELKQELDTRYGEGACTIEDGIDV